MLVRTCCGGRRKPGSSKIAYGASGAARRVSDARWGERENVGGTGRAVIAAAGSTGVGGGRVLQPSEAATGVGDPIPHVRSVESLCVIL